MLQEPLSQAQVAAACRFHDKLPEWCRSEAAIAKLRKAIPGFSGEDCLLKVAAVNAIYGTNVLAIVRMAEHVTKMMASAIIRERPLVDEIAALPTKQGKNPDYRTSFASKFCHFFLDAEKFPIYDEAAREAFELHLGTNDAPEKAFRYQAFCERFDRLRSEAKLNCTTRELDRYLWLTGMYMKWQKEKEEDRPKVNAELLRVFRDSASDADLRAFLPPVLLRRSPVTKKRAPRAPASRTRATA